MNRKKIARYAVVVFGAIVIGISSAVQASTYLWWTDSNSYRVYMEIVPAELVQHQPTLWDGDKQLHSLKVDEMADRSHVLVWLYRKPDGSKALDATIIAEAGPLEGEKLVKPLEKMKMKTGVVYGNIFNVHRDEKHVVSLKIYGPNSNGYEEVRFEHDDR